MPLDLVYRSTIECDHCRTEATLVTDGAISVVLTPAWLGQPPRTSRDRETVEASCPVPQGSTVGGDSIPCPGTLTWRLDDPDTWQQDHEFTAMLALYGQAVEQ